MIMHKEYHNKIRTNTCAHRKLQRTPHP